MLTHPYRETRKPRHVPGLAHLLVYDVEWDTRKPAEFVGPLLATHRPPSEHISLALPLEQKRSFGGYIYFEKPICPEGFLSPFGGTPSMASQYLTSPSATCRNRQRSAWSRLKPLFSSLQLLPQGVPGPKRQNPRTAQASTRETLLKCWSRPRGFSFTQQNTLNGDVNNTFPQFEFRPEFQRIAWPFNAFPVPAVGRRPKGNEPTWKNKMLVPCGQPRNTGRCVRFNLGPKRRGQTTHP